MDTILVWMIVGVAGLLLGRKFLAQFRDGNKLCCGGCSGCPSKGKEHVCCESSGERRQVEHERSSR
ncbi:MAG: FeoB-associated Cys-rich membrane protein [Deltaproteobacteria bacterium]|mgnify:CR=1 FL=1|nr:FeoB-associated Cys-rich membrane protein [Deltaproteobacteria bacterium]